MRMRPGRPRVHRQAVTPDHVAAVERSWADLGHRRFELVTQLQACFEHGGHVELAEIRARWLVDAVTELVGQLSEPSCLAEHARQRASTWPVAGSAPSFAVDGQAWMTAGRATCPTWTAATETAWRHAWLLLSEELAEESLSPFAGQSTAKPDRSGGVRLW